MTSLFLLSLRLAFSFLFSGFLLILLLVWFVCQFSLIPCLPLDFLFLCACWETDEDDDIWRFGGWQKLPLHLCFLACSPSLFSSYTRRSPARSCSLVFSFKIPCVFCLLPSLLFFVCLQPLPCMAFSSPLSSLSFLLLFVRLLSAFAWCWRSEPRRWGFFSCVFFLLLFVSVSCCLVLCSGSPPSLTFPQVLVSLPAVHCFFFSSPPPAPLFSLAL